MDGLAQTLCSPPDGLPVKNGVRLLLKQTMLTIQMQKQAEKVSPKETKARK
jgi:hypothetical protein